MSTSLNDRFEAKFQKSEGCWIWMSGLTTTGYGSFTIDNKSAKAHRVAYQIYVGPVPRGMHVLHRCDNRKCVNPHHLFLGTNQTNIDDKVSKGRQLKGERCRFTKLTADQVKEVFQLFTNGLTKTAIAKKFNVSDVAIGKIIRGKSWKSAIR